MDEFLMGLVLLVVYFVAGYIYRGIEVERSINKIGNIAVESASLIEEIRVRADDETKAYIDKRLKDILEKIPKA